MGNCCQKFLALKIGKFRTTDYRNISILLIGLDNAGKTSIANGISGNLTNPVLPTVGFSSVSIKFKKYSVTLYDVGGGPQIRNIWSQYYGNVHGFIFIIDASDVARLNECKEVFLSMIWHDKVFGKPILIYLNKQDKEGTMHEFDITEHMDVEKLVNLRQCPTKVEICSALPREQISGCRHNYIPDPSLISGFRWLVSFILLHYKHLNDQVLNAERQQLEDAERRRNEWRQNIKDRGTTRSNDSSKEVNFKNPFRPISEFFKESDDTKVIKNGSVGKASSSKNSHLQRVNAVVERNGILPPVDPANSSNFLLNTENKNSHLTIPSTEDKDDLDVFYAKALQPTDDVVSNSPDLSVFTISGRDVPSDSTAEMQPDERMHSAKDSDYILNKSGRALFPFRRVNKTAPAPLDTLSAKRNSSTEPQRGNEDNLSKNQNILTTCQLELAPIISRQAETNLDHRIPGETVEIHSRVKGIFTRNKPITSSTECILTDSDSADVVM
nr:PREDICTED: ADP-ribosylation factor-like protein 13B isoform X1 [Bemisia tabaci]